MNKWLLQIMLSANDLNLLFPRNQDSFPWVWGVSKVYELLRADLSKLIEKKAFVCRLKNEELKVDESQNNLKKLANIVKYLAFIW